MIRRTGASSQYETAAAAIPPIESQIVQTENGLMHPLGHNPGPIERGKSLPCLRPCRAVRLAVSVARTKARPRPGRVDPSCRKRSDRRCQGALFPRPSRLPAPLGQPGSDALQPLQGPCPDMELCRVFYRADFHCRRNRRAGQAGRSSTQGGAPVLSERHPKRLRGRGKCAHPMPNCLTNLRLKAASSRR